jgi:outer membrane protein OmpA-like peptidoglycan-associated protein
MMDEEDRDTRFAVSLVIALAIAICLFVIALATAAALGAFDKKKTPAAPVATAGTSSLAADDAGAVRVSETLVSVYFAFAKSALPANTQTTLAPLVEAQRAKGGKLVVSGYHDASGDAALNAELAKQRAFAVRDMLLALGLGEQAIELAKPAVTMGGADPRHARRVDISLQ